MNAFITPAPRQNGLKLLELHDYDIGQHAEGDAGNHGAHDKNDRHQRAHPQGVCLDRAENKAGIAMEKASHGDTDPRHDRHRFFVFCQ